MSKLIDTIALSLALLLCFTLTACGEKAPPIALPALAEITSIESTGGSDDVVCTDSTRIEAFYQKLLSAKPTSKPSVQDIPAAENATRFDLVHDSGITSIFVYEENGTWYVEQPYQGIYETDESLPGLLQA